LNLLKSIVGIVTFVDIKLFYGINSDAVRLFADSSFLVFSGFEYVMISIDVIYRFEWISLFLVKKKKLQRIFQKKHRFHMQTRL
jgi:hypothetical protein